MELVYKEECYAIMGACFAVYREMGSGFLESVYQECLEIELKAAGIPFTSKPELGLTYCGTPLAKTFAPDLVCYGKIIVELKAISKLADEHRAQLLNYLAATGHALGLLVNFGHHPGVEWERIANTRLQR